MPVVTFFYHFVLKGNQSCGKHDDHLFLQREAISAESEDTRLIKANLAKWWPVNQNNQMPFILDFWFLLVHGHK